jgi:hypothetical protein
MLPPFNKSKDFLYTHEVRIAFLCVKKHIRSQACIDEDRSRLRLRAGMLCKLEALDRFLLFFGLVSDAVFFAEPA